MLTEKTIRIFTKMRIIAFTLPILIVLAFTQERALTDREAEGKRLFRKCDNCHSIDDRIKKGPGLKDALKRIPGGNWRYNFIRDAQRMIDEGDPYAVKIYQQYNRQRMTSFPKLSNDQIDQIFEYIEAMNKD